MRNVEDKQLSLDVEPQIAVTLEVDSPNVPSAKLEKLLKEYRLKKVTTIRHESLSYFHE